MNNYDFTESRLFLQKMIEDSKDNDKSLEKLLDTYKILIEKKAEFDISWLKTDEELRKDFEKNQTERIKAQTEVTKTSIQQNGLMHR